ncbi:uncharacterized protein LOC107136551 [Marmota marmota marmota]|uniref:uncharacterized protein LOC107136551 n=1 Tax=Marmota marmota marmota TaxID=9994 RepID=UPI0020920819|nr:uncharacterized protein LOC107136551 [Marmota marmota marmota]
MDLGLCAPQRHTSCSSASWRTPLLGSAFSRRPHSPLRPLSLFRVRTRGWSVLGWVSGTFPWSGLSPVSVRLGLCGSSWTSALMMALWTRISRPPRGFCLFLGLLLRLFWPGVSPRRKLAVSWGLGRAELPERVLLGSFSVLGLPCQEESNRKGRVTRRCSSVPPEVSRGHGSPASGEVAGLRGPGTPAQLSRPRGPCLLPPDSAPTVLREAMFECLPSRNHVWRRRHHRASATADLGATTTHLGGQAAVGTTTVPSCAMCLPAQKPGPGVRMHTCVGVSSYLQASDLVPHLSLPQGRLWGPSCCPPVCVDVTGGGPGGQGRAILTLQEWMGPASGDARLQGDPCALVFSPPRTSPSSRPAGLAGIAPVTQLRNMAIRSTSRAVPGVAEVAGRVQL